MLPCNGYIEVKTAVGGGIDADGIPIAAQEAYGSPIPARIQTLRRSKDGRYEDGRFIESSYYVFIPIDRAFEADEVRITHNGHMLGDFLVQNIEYLTLVGRIKITL